MFSYKEENSLAKRTQESEGIKRKWPGKIPIIIERSPTSQLEALPKSKFLCQAEYTVLQFLGCLRKKMNLLRDVALFVFVNGTELFSGDASMSAIYESKKDEDGFLYLTISDQEVMGNK